MTPRPSRGAPAAVASRPASPRAQRRAVLAEVAELLAGPGLAWVVQRVRGQLETGADPVAVLQLPSSTHAQRTGARALLGPAAVVRGTHLSVRASDVEELLREVTGWSDGLVAALRALDADPGPDDDDGGDGDDGDAVVLPPAADVGVVGPPPRATPAPLPQELPVPVVVPVELDEAQAFRMGLALADVALVLDLPVAAGGPTGTALTALAAAGLPAVLTLQQLRDAPPTWLPAPPGGTALVCASPAVLAAVAGTPAAGRRRRVPVVCLDAAATAPGADPGWPGDAVVVVLEGLRGAGWRLLLNAGDGPEGEVMTELLAGEHDAQVWRSPADPGAPLREQLLGDARRLAR